MSGERSFLDQHRASLVPAGSGGALKYEVLSDEYGSAARGKRGRHDSDCGQELTIALGIAEMILKHHLPPSLPEPEVPPWIPSALPTGRHMILGKKAA